MSPGLRENGETVDRLLKLVQMKQLARRDKKEKAPIPSRSRSKQKRTIFSFSIIGVFRLFEVGLLGAHFFIAQPVQFMAHFFQLHLKGFLPFGGRSLGGRRRTGNLLRAACGVFP